MRWELLFEDLEAQLASARSVQAREGLPDLVRAELATTRLADRLRASLGMRLRVALGELGDEREASREVQVEGVLADLGDGWVLLVDPPVRQSLVPLTAVQAVSGLAPHVAPATGRVPTGLGLPHALRALARDRVEVRLGTRARTFVGRIDRVGADYVDVTPESGPGWTVPLCEVLVVRSR